MYLRFKKTIENITKTLFTAYIKRSFKKILKTFNLILLELII